jgi:CheY-like chemotaxis protein
MGHKILRADDSITIQKVIELTFSDEDFELHTVGNGQKVMDEIRSIMPDIVLCDIIMPEKNGYQVCEFIKSADDLKHIPVLLLTGAFEPFDQERAKAAGCEGFLTKPFEPQTLLSKVKELLAGAATSAAALPAPAAPEPMAPPFAETPATVVSDFEETVLVPPPMPGTPPPIGGLQVAAAPTPLPQIFHDAGPGMNEDFVVEAGARELAMGPSDQTVLLPGSESADFTSPSPAIGRDDIWSDDAEAAPAPSAPATPQSSIPPAEEEDAATVFMSLPLMVSDDEPMEADDMTMMNLGVVDPDATWQMPDAEPSTAEPAALPPAPETDFGGFSDFASPEPPVPEPAPPMDRTPVLEPPPPPPPSAPGPPPMMLTMDAIEPELDELMHRDTGTTVERTVESQPVEPSPLASPPPVIQLLPPALVQDSVEAFEPLQSFSEEPPMVASPEPVHTPSRPEAPAQSGPVDDDLIEQIAQRVVDKLSQKVIQEIAWEVVPDLAEGLIQREIEALKSKIPK